MKRLFLLFVLAVIITSLSVPAFALNDAEYLNWKETSKEFRESDEAMTESYNACKNILPKSDFKRIQQEQREWIKHGRDERAEEIIEKENCSRMEAYIKATDERSYDLYHNVQMYELWYYDKYGRLPPGME